MSRSPFIAARSSRHRTAALALYRALVRTASRVPLPEDAQRPGSAAAGPVVKIVRRCFAKNRQYTSFRLIYAAMTAGYKFLTLLTKAQISNSPEHAQVIGHLDSLRNASAASRAVPSPRRKPQSPPPQDPLLINVAKPGEPPKYTSNVLPRPKSSLQGDRRIPALCSTADGQPFLRIKKPQPRALSRMVGRKGKIFSSRIYGIVNVDEELAPAAALEDEWDSLMDELLRKEAQAEPKPHFVTHDPKSTFSWSAQLSRLWCEWKVEKTWEDWVARGTALHHLVEEERALAEQEKGGDSANENASRKLRRLQGPRPNVAEYPTPPLPLVEAVNAAQLGQPGATQEDMKDPFVSRAWATLVSSEQYRLLKWARKRSLDQNNGSQDFGYPWKRPDKEVAP